MLASGHGGQASVTSRSGPTTRRTTQLMRGAAAGQASSRSLAEGSASWLHGPPPPRRRAGPHWYGGSGRASQAAGAARRRGHVAIITSRSLRPPGSPPRQEVVQSVVVPGLGWRALRVRRQLGAHHVPPRRRKYVTAARRGQWRGLRAAASQRSSQGSHRACGRGDHPLPDPGSGLSTVSLQSPVTAASTGACAALKERPPGAALVALRAILAPAGVARRVLVGRRWQRVTAAAPPVASSITHRGVRGRRAGLDAQRPPAAAVPGLASAAIAAPVAAAIAVVVISLVSAPRAVTVTRAAPVVAAPARLRPLAQGEQQHDAPGTHVRASAHRARWWLWWLGRGASGASVKPERLHEKPSETHAWVPSLLLRICSKYVWAPWSSSAAA